MNYLRLWVLLAACVAGMNAGCGGDWIGGSDTAVDAVDAVDVAPQDVPDPTDTTVRDTNETGTPDLPPEAIADEGLDQAADEGQDESPPDVAPDADEDVSDAQEDVSDTTEPWPPTDPWYTATECTLPTCDEAVELPFDHSGDWQLTTTTTATDCNELMRQSDPRFTVGAVHTGSAHILDFVGTCDYLPDRTTQMGTFKGDTEISCLVQDRPFGVKSMEVGTTKFNTDGTASGTAKIFLFDIPEIAGQPDNKCFIDMNVSLKRVSEPWPPLTPWYTATECALPTCDTGKVLPFDYSGNWQVTTYTKSTTCNEIVRAADPRFEVGAVHTGSTHPLNFVGSCDYLPDGTTQMGTFRDYTEITCQVQDRPFDVKSLEVSVTEFGVNGTAAGVVTTYLYNIPEFAGQPDNRCEIVMDVRMARVD